VKSLRAGHASLVDAFVQQHDGELMLHGLHIPEHAYGRHGTRALHQPRRTRKLLLHRSEIDKITGRLGDTGVTLVALSLYFQDGWAKVEIGLALARRDQPIIIGREAAPNIFRLSRGVAQTWWQIQLAIITAMHTDSLPRITMGLGNVLLSA
jgi:hypothetical protein